MDYADLCKRINLCRSCMLGKSGHVAPTYYIFEGTCKKIMFVVDKIPNSGISADTYFVRETIRLFRVMLADKLGYIPTMYFASVVKCIDKKSKYIRKWAYDACKMWIEEEVRKFAPDIIICYNKKAFSVLCKYEDFDDSYEFVSSWYFLDDNIPVFLIPNISYAFKRGINYIRKVSSLIFRAIDTIGESNV